MSEPRTAKNTEFDLRALLSAFAQYKWVILATTLVVATGVTLWTLRLPKVYEAVSTIEHDPNPVRPLGADIQDVADPVGSFWSTREYFETQNRIIASRAVAERVVAELGLNRDREYVGPTDVTVTDAALMLLGQLTVEPIQDTRLVELHVRDGNPERAMLLANAIAEAYIEKIAEDRDGSTRTAITWLGDQLDDLRGKLNSSELVLHQFKEDHNILSVSMEDRQNIVANEIQAFNEALTTAQRRRIELGARANRLREANAADPLTVDAPLVNENVAVNALRQTLREKLAERERLATRYGAAHPEMRALSDEITALTEQLSGEILLVISSAEADLAEAQRVEAGLRQALDQAHDAGLRLNLREIEYQRLNRERENNEKLYGVVLARSTETNLTSMVRPQHVRIVDSALEPGAPVSPNVPMNIIMGLLGGLFLGLLAGAGLHFIDRRVRTPADIEAMGANVMGIVPSVLQAAESGGARRKKPLLTDNFDLLTLTHPMSAVAECCRAIRTNLTFMSPDDPIRSLVVTSPTPQEGKTTVACNLAISIAQSGKRVLLIDTDLRRPRVHKTFDLDASRGVTTVIVGEAPLSQVAQATAVHGLDVLPCGPVPPNPSELLHANGFTELLRAALEQYDRVIFDSPPLGAVTDAAVLAPQVDGVIVVVKANKTTRDGLGHALRQLDDVSANLLGIILNDVDLNSSSYGGDGYYQYYYRYHYYSEANEQAGDVEAAE